VYTHHLSRTEISASLTYVNNTDDNESVPASFLLLLGPVWAAEVISAVEGKPPLIHHKLYTQG
jgi:hypothetical protein